MRQRREIGAMSGNLSKPLGRSGRGAGVCLAIMAACACAGCPTEAQVAPLGSPLATRSGNLVVRYGQEPPTLNPVLPKTDEVYFTRYVVESLLAKNEDTYEWEPQLASSWKIVDGGLAFEFEIRSAARWSDGRPVTAEDVKFSFDLNFDARYPTAERRPGLQNVQSVKVLDAKHIRFEVADRLFLNLTAVASMRILPKHIYGDPAKALGVWPELVGSGPYKVENVFSGRRLVLVRNPQWWGKQDSLMRGKFNPERVTFQYVSDDHLAFEMLKRGELDYVDLSPEMYLRGLEQVTPHSPFELQRVTNRFTFFCNALALNMHGSAFADPRVRQALAYAVDRDTIIDKFFRGLSVKLTGPWYVQSPFADPAVQPIPFDTAKALALLKEAGWEDDGSSHFLSKVIDGKRIPLRFTVLTSNPIALRHLTFMKEDMAKAGIDMQIRIVDRTTFTQNVDARNFDAADLGWGGGPVEFDPGLGWSSKQDRPGGLNHVGYRDSEVDELIEKALRIFDFNQRIPVMRDIFRRVSAANGFLFLLNENSTYYAFSKRVGRARPYYNYDPGLRFMWIKKTKGAR